MRNFLSVLVFLAVLSAAALARERPRVLKALDAVKTQLKFVAALQKDLQSEFDTLNTKFHALNNNAEALRIKQDQDHEMLLTFINDGKLLSQIVRNEIEELLQCSGNEHTKGASCTLMPGEKGEPGVAGMQGQPGAKGEKGDEGSPGMTGQQGFPGLQGPPGKDGAEGKEGTNGEKGEQGEPGLRGAQGMPGLAGPKGDMGEVGVPGAPGEKGDPGFEGPAGRPGESGVMGFPGLPGVPGQKGEKGDPYFPDQLPPGLQGSS